MKEEGKQDENYVFENSIMMDQNQLSGLRVEIEFCQKSSVIATNIAEVDPSKELRLKTSIDCANKDIFKLVQKLVGKVD